MSLIFLQRIRGLAELSAVPEWAGELILERFRGGDCASVPADRCEVVIILTGARRYHRCTVICCRLLPLRLVDGRSVARRICRHHARIIQDLLDELRGEPLKRRRVPARRRNPIPTIGLQDAPGIVPSLFLLQSAFGDLLPFALQWSATLEARTTWRSDMPTNNEKPPEPVLPPGLSSDDYTRAQMLVNGFMAGYVKLAQAGGGKPPCSPNALTTAMMFSAAFSFVEGKTPREQFLALARLAFDNGEAHKKFIEGRGADGQPADA